MSDAVVHDTAIEEVALIERLAPRFGDDPIARVQRQLGRRTAKGKR